MDTKVKEKHNLTLTCEVSGNLSEGSPDSFPTLIPLKNGFVNPSRWFSQVTPSLRLGG